jgi:hypothetical protein
VWRYGDMDTALRPTRTDMQRIGSDCYLDDAKRIMLIAA